MSSSTMYIHGMNSFKLVTSISSIILMTVVNWQSGKTISQYTNKKIIRKIRKLRRPSKRSQTMLIVPKLLIFFYILLSHEFRQLGRNKSDCLKSNKRHFLNVEFLKFCRYQYLHFQNKQMSEIVLSQLKIQNRNQFFKFLLLLSGDVELNPGPNQPIENTYSCFKKKGLHFFHLNINSVLKKIDELRIIA